MSAAERMDQPKHSGAVIPASHVQMAHRPAASGDGASQAPEPGITVFENAGVVTAIEIVCTCGEVIRLECQY
ncbi:MAG: hypothetical protein HYR84_11005 [Planctomycetes bacterium]|nr:hypothetical protein [Planctomycetota bacterium]